MTSRHYDVVVLGADLAPLTCAALLAKRGFRVLALGHTRADASYRVGAHRLPRRPCLMTAHGTPVAERVLGELGLTPSVRRLTRELDPGFQAALPHHRVDLSPDATWCERELEREFPSVKRPALDFLSRVRELSRAVDAMFSREATWPPDTLWDRRRASRADAQVPFDADSAGPDLLAEFPDDHPFRTVGLLPSAFAADAAGAPTPALAVARLFTRCHHGVALEGGHAALLELVGARLAAHGGTLRLTERVRSIAVRRGAALAVSLVNSEEEISAGFVVAGTDVSTLMRLMADRTPFEEFYDHHGEPQVCFYRYTLNVVLGAGSLPPGAGPLVFFARRAPTSRELIPAADACLLQRTPLAAAHELVTIEALLPSHQVENEHGYLDGRRAHLLDMLEELHPFTRDRIVLVDSPHDGLPPEVHARGIDVTLDPRDRRGPTAMQGVSTFPVTSQHALCALPVRSPVHRLLLCNTQNLPALGMEGQWLAAESAARIVTRSDRASGWMRRRPWSRVRV